jgi:hypothetical protein
MWRALCPALLAALALLPLVDGKGGRQPSPASALKIDVESRNPWTHLRIGEDGGRFRFAVVGDRTGGHRGGVFALAVERLNWLRPDFVLSVGDLIEGYRKEDLAAEWAEFQGLVGKLTVPFFYVPGNHDYGEHRNKAWNERFGRSYYHFQYKGVLFLVLNSNIDGEKGRLGAAQVAEVRKVLREHADARWTFLFLHHALWADPAVDRGDWLDVEKALAGRRYTVFCGHGHTHHKWVRQGANYYMMATTGGASGLTGPRYGMMDHVTWVSMEAEPVISNIVLDGVYPDDLCLPATVESSGSGYNPKTMPWPRVEVRVLLDGKPAAGKIVHIFEMKDGKPVAASRQLFGFVGDDGAVIPWIERWPARTFSLAVSDYRGQFAGRPVHLELIQLRSKSLPPRYADPATSGLTITTQGGHEDTNRFVLQLRSGPADR